MRGPFTLEHNNFEKSRQYHNGTLFRFLDFVQRNGHGELYSVSKPCVIKFVVMRVGQRVEGMLGLSLRIIPQGAGFGEAGVGLYRTPGDPQSGGNLSDGDADCSRGRRRKMNIGEDTRYLCDHIQGLTNFICNHCENDCQRGESMVGQVGRDGKVSVAAGGARQSNGNAAFQAL